MMNLCIAIRLQHNYTPTCPIPDSDKMCSWYHHMWKKIYHMTNVWRGEVSPVKLLIPPVSPDNETTNNGAAIWIMSLLLMHGVIKAMSHDGTNIKVKGLTLAPDYKDWYVMLVGDGLLHQVRAKTFKTIIEESCYWFKETQRATEMICNVLGQVIHITGDVHGGRFHFLSVIFAFSMVP